jgi:hypothetical protein
MNKKSAFSPPEFTLYAAKPHVLKPSFNVVAVKSQKNIQFHRQQEAFRADFQQIVTHNLSKRR